VTMWQISSPWFVGPSTRRSSGTVLAIALRTGCHEASGSARCAPAPVS
jgi:hypothetical protein